MRSSTWIFLFLVTLMAPTNAKFKSKSLIEGYLDPNLCLIENPIDKCWRCDINWALNRQNLADCALGFGSSAMGGKNGQEYIVTDESDDPKNPQFGTLRYGVIQREPLWITFVKDMVIVLKKNLVITSNKTIDGRGQDVHIASGACITLRNVSNIIIHGVHVHNCSVGEGDGISLRGATKVWIDHVTMSQCRDGLIDVTRGSTNVTISNSFFSNHNKVMLLGHSDTFEGDKNMQVSVVYNHFGQNLTQRMPRCRFGFFEVVNNVYIQWRIYAIGGSASPTINSQGNCFTAPNDPLFKNVTLRLIAPQIVWKDWNWSSYGDMFFNDAQFVSSGAKFDDGGAYINAQSNIIPLPASQVHILTADAGALACYRGYPC